MIAQMQRIARRINPDAVVVGLLSAVVLGLSVWMLYVAALVYDWIPPSSP